MHEVPTANGLKTVLKQRLDSLDEPSRIRLHRAVSWLARAESEPDDPDARFIFLWIAFNAAYAQEFGFEHSEREQLQGFITRLLSVDRAGVLHGILFEKFSGPIRTLIENRYVFEPFWRALREHDASGRWEDQFSASRRAALFTAMSRDTAVLLSIVLDRLYVLRCQLVHGGATWNSRVNRAQVKDGAHILGSLVPAVIELMLGAQATDFGGISYPVIPER